MTAFQFMANSFYILVGIACAGAAAVIVYAVAAGIYRGVKGARKNGKR